MKPPQQVCPISYQQAKCPVNCPKITKIGAAGWEVFQTMVFLHHRLWRISSPPPGAPLPPSLTLVPTDYSSQFFPNSPLCSALSKTHFPQGTPTLAVGFSRALQWVILGAGWNLLYSSEEPPCSP